jgi:hypothetical protein
VKRQRQKTQEIQDKRKSEKVKVQNNRQLITDPKKKTKDKRQKTKTKD